MNIDTIKRRLLIKFPPFGSIIANTNFVSEESINTASTDGENIYYNSNFINSLSDDKKIFIFAHEVCHIAFNHIFRSDGKNPKLWNIATDAVINASLKKEGLMLVEGVIDIPNADNYDAEEMYQKLLDEIKENQDSNSQDGNQNDSSENNNQNSNSQNDSQNDSSENNNQNSNLQNDSQNDSSENNNQNSNLQNDSQNDSSKNNNQNSNSQNDSQNDGSSNKNQNSDSQNGNQNDSSSNKNQNSDSQDGNQNDSENENTDVGHDTHSMWKKAVENKKQREKEEKNQNEVDKNIDSEKKRKNEDIKKFTELGEKESFKQNKVERKKQLEELRKALVSQSHGYGSDTNSNKRNVNDIGKSEPLIDWRLLLKEAVKYDVDWSFQNAGIEEGVVTPYLEEQPKPETEIVLDTSGSIQEVLLKNFLRECKNILQTSKVKVGCFDTKFYGFTEIKNESDIDRLQFYGGGGTDFDVAVAAFTKRVENKIIFTDGYSSMPDMPLDAIWVVFDDCKINPKGGKVIYINDEQLRKLQYCEIYYKANGRTR